MITKEEIKAFCEANNMTPLDLVHAADVIKKVITLLHEKEPSSGAIIGVMDSTRDELEDLYNLTQEEIEEDADSS